MAIKREETASVESKTKNTTNAVKNLLGERNEYNAYDLYKSNVTKIPKLIDPFFQTVGLASLVGTSDGGKSTFLRQLSLAIVLKLDNFLNFKINGKHNKVIYVSTEDDPNTVSYSIREQINSLMKANKLSKEDIGYLKNLEFIFETNELHKNLSSKLKEEPVDLIVIDAFTDIFTKEINANTQVRQFLNSYDRLAKKYNCLIIFLHHIGKRTTKYNPSKDSIIGSQAFEAKMRVVLELRPRVNGENVDLWVLKSNFLDKKYKEKSFVLKHCKNSMFKNSNIRGNKKVDAKSSNVQLVKKVMELSLKKMSTRDIEKELENTEYKVSKSLVAEIIKDQKANV